jgi:hypothetical protein
MDRAELFALTTRIRRATRPVIALCDEVERAIRSLFQLMDRSVGYWYRRGGCLWAKAGCRYRKEAPGGLR